MSNPFGPPPPDPRAALARLRLERLRAQQGTARATFEPLTPRAPSVPGLAEAAAGAEAGSLTAALSEILAPQRPARDVTGMNPPPPLAPPPQRTLQPVSASVAAGRQQADEAARVADALARAEQASPAHYPREFLKGVVKGAAGMAGTVTGVVAPGLTREGLGLLEAGLPSGGPADIAGRLAGGLAGGGALYSALARAIALGAAPESVAAGLTRGIQSPRLLPRVGANIAVGAPLDVVSGVGEAALGGGTRTADPVRAWAEDKGLVSRDTDPRVWSIGRNLAMGAAGAGVIEGARHPFVRPPLADNIGRSFPQGVQDFARESAGQPLWTGQRVEVSSAEPPARVPTVNRYGVPENLDPIGEARAANPLTDTDPARARARAIEEAQRPPLPPEAYVGPERRVAIEPVSADDILNKHRRAADLPPTTAPLVPRAQSGVPQTRTGSDLQGVTRTEFPSAVPVADETAVLERLAMQERSAASELAAQRLGRPPAMEGAPPVLPAPGTKGRMKFVGGDKKFQYHDAAALEAEYDKVLARLDDNNATFNAGTTMWTRDDPNLGGVQRSGTSISGEAGRARGGVSRDAAYLGRIEEELNRRGMDPVEVRQRIVAARAERAKAEAAERLPADYFEPEAPPSLPGGGSVEAQRAPYQPSLFDRVPDAPPPHRAPLSPEAERAVKRAEESFATRTALVTRSTEALGAARVTTPEEAARATAYLGRGAAERLDGLVTDANGTPLALVGGFKGEVGQSFVPFQSLVTEAFQVPGAAHLWLSHNHPSGTATLSSADLAIDRMVAEAFRGSGIKYRGILAVGGGVDPSARSFAFRSDAGDIDAAGTVGPITKGPTVPRVDREFTAHGQLAPATIRNSQDAVTAIERYGGGESGLLLLDSQSRPVGFLPVTPEAAGRLRVDRRMDPIYRGLGVSNAANVIVSAPDMLPSSAQNLASMVKAMGVNVLDIIGPPNKVPRSFAEGGTRLTNVGGQFGFADPGTLGAVAGAGLGAATGAATGDPEDRGRNLALGAMLGMAAGSFGAAGGPGFRSRLVEAAERIKLEKAPARTWLAKLRGMNSSADEFDWALGEALRADPLKSWTKAEIVAQAKARGYGALTETVRHGTNSNTRPSPTDVVWEGDPDVDGFTLYDQLTGRRLAFASNEGPMGQLVMSALDRVDERAESYMRDLEEFTARAQRNAADGYDAEAAQWYEAAEMLNARAEVISLGRGGEVKPARYAAYTEPGGENYREVLLRVPEKLPDGFSVQEFGDIDGGKTWGVVFPDGRVVTGWKTREAAISSQRNQKGATSFTSSHWDEPNVLAHIRMNDRTGPNGEKVLHIEEIQSDWHQKGRQEGYAKDTRGWTARLLNDPKESGFTHWEIRDAQGNVVTKIVGGEEESAIREAAKGIPDAPFKETPEWLGLALKRVLDEAVAGGYDAISWTPGVKQADRYSLRKVADEVLYHPEDGQLRVSRRGKPVHEGLYDPKALPSVIGKEATDRLLASPPDDKGWRALEGDDLEVGGQGMRAFYDQMVPDLLRSYAKKLGVRVDVGEAPLFPKGGPLAPHWGEIEDVAEDLTTGMGGRSAVPKADQKLGDALTAFIEEHDGRQWTRDEWKTKWENAADSHDLSRAKEREGWRVIEAAMPAEGPGMAPMMAVGPELKAALGKGQTLGAASVPTLTGVAGAGLGAATGAALGDEEHRGRNAALGAAVGAGLGAGVGALAGHGKSPPGLSTDPIVRQMRQTIVRGPRAKPQGWLSWAERLYTHVFAEDYPLAKLGRTAFGDDRLRETVVQQRGWSGAARQRLDDQLRPIVQAVRGREEDVAALVKAQRGLDILAKGGENKTGMDVARMQHIVQTLGSDPVLAQAATDLQAYYRDLLELRHQVGLLDDGQYQAIVQSEDFYTPFAREMDDQAPSSGAGRWTNRSRGVARMDRETAASAPTRDPFEMAVLHTAATFRAAAKQRVTNIVSAIVEQHPDAVQGLIRPLDGSEKAREGREVTAIVNGARKRYEVSDPDLYDAWGGFDTATTNLLVSLLRASARTQRFGVTILPDFMAANAIRDNAFTAVQRRFPLVGGVGGAAVGAAAGAALSPDDRRGGALIGAGLGAGVGALGQNLGRSFQYMKAVLGNDALYQQFLREGGDAFGFYARSPQDAQQVLRELRRQGVGPNDIILPRTPWGLLRYLGNAVEQGPRLRAYAEARAAGRGPRTAVSAARDISVDFSEHGSRTAGIASLTPFWNAQMQGWDKLARLLKSPKFHATAAATITAPSLALWALNKDNPEYWDRSQVERNLFWLVPKPNGGFYRVMKPFEVGFLYGSVPERMADWLYQRAKGGDTQAGLTLARSLGEMGTSLASSLAPVPTGVRVAGQQALNRDFFWNRDIVTRPNVPAPLQYDDYTSSLGVLAGQAGEAVGLPVSPQRVQNFVQTQFGGLGRLATDVADQAVRGTPLDPRPVTRTSRTPLVSRFTTNPESSTDAERALKREAADIAGILEGARKLAKEGNWGRLERYQQDHADILRPGRRIALTAGAARRQALIRRYDRLRDRLRTMQTRGEPPAELTRLRDELRDIATELRSTPVAH